MLEDYADVANGLYELHVATGELRWLEESHRLATLAVELFGDAERGGFYETASDAEQLILRKKSFDDHPTPSGNSMLASVLLRLSRIYGDDELEQRGVGALRLVQTALTRMPSAFGWALCALDLHLSPHRELAIVGPRLSGRPRGAGGLRPECRRRLRPRRRRAAPRGQDAGRRPAGRLRLRALRLPGSRHRSGGAPDALIRLRAVPIGHSCGMGIGTSLIVVAAGAILIWAVDVTVSGIDLTTVGWILFVIGLVGTFLSLIFWTSWGGPRGAHRELPPSA